MGTQYPIPAISRRAMLGASTFALMGCATTGGATSSADARVTALIERAGASVRPPREASLPYQGQTPPHRLPGLSERYYEENASRARGWLAEADAMAQLELSESVREDLDVFRWDIAHDVEYARHYWHSFPVGPQLTLLGTAQYVFGAAVLETREDCERYRELVSGAPTYISEIEQKLRVQAQRNIYQHREQIPTMLARMRATRADLNAWVGLSDERFANVDPAIAAQVREQVGRNIETEIAPPLDRLIAYVENDYAPHAGGEVRRSRNPGGAEFYAWLVRSHTSVDITPEEANRQAVEDLARIEDELARLRPGIDNGSDSADEFHRRLGRDPRWIASDVDQIQRWFDAALDRIRPRLNEFIKPLATPYEVLPLDPVLRGSLLNGYYDNPTEQSPRGVYYFNPNDLDTTSWLWAAPLIYHELTPGHHSHFDRYYTSSATLSPYRRSFGVRGFNEGWGEYARFLADEMGAYEGDPWNRYADTLLYRRFAMAAVMDTSMQVAGWSVDDADRFFSTEPLSRASQRRRNVFTWAGDQAGSSLSYWLGNKVFRRFRDRANAHASGRFDLPQYHDDILTSGSIPFDVLETRLRNRGYLPAA